MWPLEAKSSFRGYTSPIRPKRIVGPADDEGEKGSLPIKRGRRKRLARQKLCCRPKKSSTLHIHYINQTTVLSKVLVHWLLTLSWPELVSVSVGLSLIVIIFFAILFFLLDDFENSWDGLHAVFAMSSQTFLTIGYGTLAPRTAAGHAIVFFETFCSVVVLSLATGIPYKKFSKPSQKIDFAKPVVNQDHFGPRLQMRFAMNVQNAQLTNVNINLTLARSLRTPNGTVCSVCHTLQNIFS